MCIKQNSIRSRDALKKLPREVILDVEFNHLKQHTVVWLLSTRKGTLLAVQTLTEAVNRVESLAQPGEQVLAEFEQ